MIGFAEWFQVLALSELGFELSVLEWQGIQCLALALQVDLYQEALGLHQCN